MEKAVTDLLEYLEAEKDGANIWDIERLLDNPQDFKNLAKIFTPEQLRIIKAIVKKSIWALDTWHNQEDEESHDSIRKSIKNLEAKFRNHRHETGKTFSAKPEY